MTCVIVGGSAGLGRALAEECARVYPRLIIASSDLRDLEAIRADLHARVGIDASCCVIDGTNPVATATRILATVGADSVRALLFPIGSVLEDDTMTAAPAAAQALLSTNLLSVIATVSALRPRLIAAGDAVVVGFSSIAAVRGRNRNVVYAAAKRGLISYFESLRHDLEPAGVRTHLYIAGYVDTNLAYGRKLLFPKLSPVQFARDVCMRLSRPSFVTYWPRFWYVLASIVRILPWRLYRLMKF
jgi:NAD(P)-dependent dehydrogenase (short-subunit alcohol dehydrogenase family)